jgi:hypothetical protein
MLHDIIIIANHVLTELTDMTVGTVVQLFLHRQSALPVLRVQCARSSHFHVLPRTNLATQFRIRTKPFKDSVDLISPELMELNRESRPWKNVFPYVRPSTPMSLSQEAYESVLRWYCSAIGSPASAYQKQRSTTPK